MDNDTQKLIQLLKNVEKSGDQIQSSPPIENNFDSKSQFQPQMTANLINSFLQSPNTPKPSSRTNSPYSSFSPNLNFYNQNSENNSNELSSYIPPETKEIEIKLDGNYSQTKCMNITKCETVVNLPIGQIIDSNRNFICYVVKNSLIRVIHKNTGATGLCRGPHTQPITDIKFVYDDTLSSVGQDGNIFFWKLSHSNNKTHVDLLLNICPPDSTDSVSYTRLCYNTMENPLFAVISKNNTVYIWNLPEQINQRNTSVPVVDFNETSPLTLKSNDEILDFCFWNNQLVTADSAGKLKFWNLSSQSVQSEVLLHNAPINSVIFILDSYVLTASQSNKELKLWNVNSLFHSSGSRTPLQTILFIGDNQSDGCQLLSYNFEASILAAASVNMPVLSLLHFCAKRKRFNYITKFNSLENSLSISSLRNELDIEIYAVQPKSIRVYTSKIELLVPIDNSFVVEDDNVELENNANEEENACENNENNSDENEKEENENENNENGDDENASEYNDNENENDNDVDGNEADYDNNDNQKEISDVNLKYLEGSDNSDSNIVHDLHSIEDNTTSDNNDNNNNANKINEDSSNNIDIKNDNSAKPSPKKSNKRRERRNKKEPIESPTISSNSNLILEQLRGNIDLRFKEFESNITNQFNQSLLQLKHNMEKERAERERIEREQQARLLEAISKTVNQNLQRYVKEELNKLVPSVLSPILSANEKLEASSKVLNFDLLTKEIKNAVTNTLSNRINENIGNSIRTPVQHELKNHFGTVLAPAIENSYQKMFSQLNNAFNQGLDHHFYQLSLKEASSTAEHLTNIVSQLNKVCDSMTDSISQRRNPSSLFPPPDPFNSRPPPPHQPHFPPEPFPSSRPQTYHPVTTEYLFERPPSPRYNPPPPSPYKPPLSYSKNPPRHPGESLPFPPPYSLSHSNSSLPPPFSGYPMDDPYARMPHHLPPLHPNPKVADLFSDSNLNNNSLEAALAHKLKTSLTGNPSASTVPPSAALNSFLTQASSSNSNSNIILKQNGSANNNNNSNTTGKQVTKSASNPKTSKQQKVQPTSKLQKGKSGKDDEITSSTSNPNLITKATKTQSEGSEDSHPTKDQLVIDRLVSNKEFERAFSRALSLEDLKIVIYLCTKVEPTTVFTPPIKISQLILLSLIQQLGYDLSTDTKLKLVWIRDSLLFINSSDPSIANHVGPILNQLYKNLEKFFPMFLKDPDCATTFKLLLHVVNSLLTDIQSA